MHRVHAPDPIRDALASVLSLVGANIMIVYALMVVALAIWARSQARKF